jgi:hypothetical protein
MTRFPVFRLSGAAMSRRVRQAILDGAREAFREAASRLCREMRNAPPSNGPLGDLRRAYDRMLLAWRESPEADRERARIDALLRDHE